MELPRSNEDLRRRDDHLEKVNIIAKLGSEYPSGSMEGRDYCRRMDEDRDRQSWKMLNLSEDLPQRDSPYAMFQGKREGITSNSSHSAKYFREYGCGNGSIKGISEKNYQDSGFEGLRSSRMMVEKPTYPKTDLNFSSCEQQSGNKRSYQDFGGGGSYSPLKKLSAGLHKDEELRLGYDLSRNYTEIDPNCIQEKEKYPDSIRRTRQQSCILGKKRTLDFILGMRKPNHIQRKGNSNCIQGKRNPIYIQGRRNPTRLIGK